MESKSFVLLDLPEIVDKEDYLTDYLEWVLKRSLEHIQCHPQVPDRALFTLQDAIDVKEATLLISKNPLEGCELGIETPAIRDVVVVEGDDLIDKVTPFFVKLYFQSEFGDSEEIVSSFQAIADSDMVVICFKNREVLTSILKETTHCPLPSVGYEMKVMQFCDNFHGLIPNVKLIQEDDWEEGQEPRLEKDSEDSYSFLSAEEESWIDNFSDCQSSVEEDKGNNVMYADMLQRDRNEEIVQIHNQQMNVPMQDKSWETTDVKPTRAIKLHPGISDSQAENMRRCEFTLMENDKSCLSESFKQHPTPPSSTALRVKTSEDTRPHNISGTQNLERKKVVGKHSQTTTASGDICVPLQKPFWCLIKNYLRGIVTPSFHYDAEAEVVVFKSTDENEVDIESIEDLKADIVKNREKLSEDMTSVFETSHCKKYYKSYLLSECNDEISIYTENGFLICCGFDKFRVDNVKKKVMAELFTVVEIDDQSILSEDVETLKESLGSKYKVYVNWNEHGDGKVQITGVQEDVMAVKDLILAMIDAGKMTTKHLKCSRHVSAYISKRCQEEINEILKNVKSSYNYSDDQLSIEYSGKLREVEETSSVLDDFITTIKSERIDVETEFSKEDADLIVKEICLPVPDAFFIKTCDLFMAEQKCLIINDVDEGSYTRSTSSVSDTTILKVHSPKTAVLNHASFIVNSKMQLKIKDEGNIVREKSDVLVCVLERSRQLVKTNVSKAFLSVEKDLQSTVDSLTFSTGSVELVQLHSHKIQCKAVVFVVLSPYEVGITGDNLRKAILEVLVKAADFKASSISFPPVGLGKVMKYPEDVISGQFFSAVQEFVDNCSHKYPLRKIKYLACNKILYHNMKRRGGEIFKKITKNKVGARRMDGKNHDNDYTFQKKNISISVVHSQLCNLAACWKAELKSYLNHEDEIDTMFNSLPKSFDDKVKSKCRAIPVLITACLSKSGHYVLKLKGSKDHVMQMKVYIAQEILKEGKPSAQGSSMISSRAPPRGSVAFMNYFASLEVAVPVYWKNTGGTQSSLHSVDDKTKHGIEKLLLTTWNSSQVGQGKDAAGIPSTSTLQFVSVQRIENPADYKVYVSVRNRMLERKAREVKVCKSVGEISSQGKPVLTSENLPDFMRHELCGEVNEHYLFHGTKEEIVGSIIKQGCHPNLSSPSAMFGKGIYAAESSTKADQYTDDTKRRLPSGSVHSMFLLRVLLGDVFRCTKTHPSVNGKDSDKFVRPPCKKCYKDRCTCGDNFDSVMGEDGWIFREFVVYTANQCYPEYLIEYKRV